MVSQNMKSQMCINRIMYLISYVFSIIVSMSGVLPLGDHTDGDMAAFQLNYIPVLTSNHFKTVKFNLNCKSPFSNISSR